MRSLRPFRVVPVLLLVLLWLMPIAEAAVPRCFGVKATRVGTKRGDVIRGTARKDVIVAKGGADTIKARGGNDLICAGDGSDTVDAGGGADKVDGGSGRDKLSGAAGGDTLMGGKGVDALNGGSGTDRCSAAESITSCEQPAYATSILLLGEHPIVLPEGSAASVVAEVRDQSGNLMSNAAVAFTTTGDTAPTPSAATVKTNSLGRATFSPVSETAGLSTVSACITKVGGTRACDTSAVEWQVPQYGVTVTAPCYPAREGDTVSYPVTLHVVDQFGAASPTDTVIGITSDDLNVMTGESSVQVPAGATSAPWMGTAVGSGATTITASLGTSSDSVPVSVQPASAAVTTVGLSQLTASPVAGQPASVLAAPVTDYGPASEPGGTQIDLTYSAGVSGPEQVVVLENACTVSFDVSAATPGTYEVTGCVGEVCSTAEEIYFGPATE